MNSKEVPTYLYLPKPEGDWLSAMLTAFKFAGLELYAPPRYYEYTFTSAKLPIIFEAVRSKEVWKRVQNPNTIANGGFTGSDIAYEQCVKPEWVFPLLALQPDGKTFPQPRVCVGSTPKMREAIPSPRIRDLNGKIILTTFPKIAKEFFDKYRLEVLIEPFDGTIEGDWRTIPNNWGIVDIVSTGKTFRSNCINVMEEIMSPEIVFVEKFMSSQDRLRVADLQEKIYQAAQKGGEN